VSSKNELFFLSGYFNLNGLTKFCCACDAVSSRQVSQAAIKIADAEEGSSTRRITITGSGDSVDSAYYLINAIQTKYSKN
jgi:hypothetical protein